MDSESPLPAKRLRASLNGNLQVTECIREFKLPRQFPSMVTKPSADVNREKYARQNYHASAVAALPKVSYPPKILQTKDTTLVPNLVRKIKLKAKDGRDLGEVNVQHLPQNIQGKTICLSKNTVKSQPEVAQVAEKSKGITIGVLTPVNIVKADVPIVYATESNVPSMTCVAKVDGSNFDVGHERDPKKVTIVDQKKLSAVTDSQGRPQVLVFQSGKSWHMVKIASATSPTVVKTAHGKKSVLVGKWPQLPTVGKVAANSGQNQISSSASSLHNSGEVSSTLTNKVPNSGQSSMVVRRWWQSRTPDSTTDGSKTRSPSGLKSETSKPKIEVSRIFGPTNAKENSHGQTRSPNENGRAASTESDTSSQKSTPLKQDVMVVLPGDSSLSLDEESCGETEIGRTSGCSVDKAGGALSTEIRKSVDNGGGGGPKYSRYITSAKRAERKSVDGRDKAENAQLSILARALSSVEDEKLRAKALKVLADCGIGMERLVPVKPASDKKSVKDSDTQTSVFGLWDPEEFVCVPKDGPGVQRKRPIVRKATLNVANVVGNAHSQDSMLQGFESPGWSMPTDTILKEWLIEWLKNSNKATVVQNMFEKPNSNPVRPQVVEQLEEDFNTYNKYDEDGLLNIHRAVIADQPRTVLRHLKVLKAFRESVDLHTADGKTSLELAVSCKVSLTIVKMLLDHGAQPTCEEGAHDSALIIASKKSLPVLMELIPFVSSRRSLDNYDSSGFAALHHCAQNGDEAGVKALVRASANIDLRDRRSGRTALFHAVENEHMEIAQILLDNGAQWNITNYSGHCVANLIDESKHYGFAETLNRLANSSKQ